MIGSAQLSSSEAFLGRIELGYVLSPISESFSDNVAINDSFSVELFSGSGLNWTISDNVTITSSFSVIKVINDVHYFQDNLVINDSFSLDYHSGTITDFLAITDSFFLNKSTSPFTQLIDNVLITDYFTVSGSFSRILSDFIDLSGTNFSRNVDNLVVNVPTWYYIKTTKGSYNPYVYLYSENGSVVLDSPLFGDTESKIDNVIINRAISGSRFSYVKTSKRRHLKYEFSLRCGKVDELEGFIDSSILDWLTLINWKSEVWLVMIVNDSIVIKAVSRDMYSVILEFEGYKVLNGDYRCLE